MMATNDGNIHFDAQTLVVCNDCGGHDDVINYCLNCPGNICSKCKPTHCNRKLTKSHIVLHHADSEVRKARRSTKTYCSLHSGKECKTYCMKCRLPSCSVCAKAHKGHHMADLDDLILKTEHEVNGIVRDLETELIPNTEKALSKLEAEMTSYQETMNNVKISAKDRLKKLRQQLDKLEATFFAEVDKQAKDDLNTMQEQKNEIRKNVEKAKSAMEKGKTAPLDLGLVSIKHELAEICAQKPTEISYSQHFYFHESSYRFPSPFDIIGSFNNGQEKIIRNSSIRLSVSNGHKETFDYTREFKILHRIEGNQGKFVLNTIDDHVWVYNDNEKRISVYEGSLTKINAVYIGSKSVPSGFSCVDFVKFGLHDALLADSRNDRLLRITDSGSMTKFFVTSPFKPFGICVNDERQVVVGGRILVWMIF
ncbi:hypothetical protein FSP39_001962 [Pinctada imbricata]|uniref:B box-type domain-containing protein n=1 Tax=Pinctada imbricata TaxID=66713 RepID=A0AA89BWP8_PINIB|nr:hypothetical protein FSP39_001962 [Pinctada imbricata]